MAQFYGNTTGSVKSIALNLPVNVKWLGLRNKTAGSITVNIAIIISGVEIYFKHLTIAADESYDEKVDVSMVAGSQIFLITSGSVDYSFTYENDGC